MNPKQEKQKERWTLTLVFFVAMTSALFLTLLLVGGLTALFLHFDIFHTAEFSRENLTRTTLLIALASLIVGSALTWLSLHVIMGPENRLTEGMNALAKGRYETRIVPARGGLDGRIQRMRLIRNLIGSFNTLAEELENTDLLRTDFINNFSHEFKTPIVSIAGFTRRLRRSDLTPAQRQEYLSIIEEESSRLSAMATNVLNLTKVENQTILNDVKAYSLSEQLRTCVLVLESRWEDKGLTPDLEMDEISLWGSEDLLKEVWINLLDNAIKFAEPDTLLTVRAEKADGAVQVSVANAGPAIPEAAMGRIFRKFYQADESHSTEGSGVGLAIVRRVVELHGGSVSAMCDKGITTFTVTLPQA